MGLQATAKEKRVKRQTQPKAGLAFLFDLDGTLLDSVYQHVLAWQEAQEETAVSLSVRRVHRRVDMNGGLFVSTLPRETGRRVTVEDAARLQRLHMGTLVFMPKPPSSCTPC
jgi:beta-phosphoglucomutase-like phosphatase (HAD superfamily)